MKITFLGTTSQGGHCPSAFTTDRGTYVVQGNKITDPEAIAEPDRRGMPDHETAVEIPMHLLNYFPQGN